MLKTYTPKEMKEIRAFALDQFYRDDFDTVCVVSKKTGQSVHCPWVDSSGRWEFDTDAEAIEHWGEDLFYEFCEKALVYMYKHRIEVRPWEVTKP